MGKGAEAMSDKGNKIYGAGSMIIGMRDTTIHEDGRVDIGTALPCKVELHDEAVVFRFEEGFTWVVGAGVLDGLRRHLSKVKL
jgi:hypothetical protein